MRFGNFKVVFLSLAFLLFAGVLNAGDYIIFYDDFGELDSDNESHRSQSEYVNDVSRGGAFNYRSDCVPIKGQNFSDYAVVSTPFWSGCTFHDEYDISTCDCTEGFWFKHCFDHTHNGINPATGKFGGMLFINPQSDNIPDDFSVLVYSREFRNTCENSFVSFSVWFRSATELWPGMSLDPIRSRLRVKHTDTGEYISEADIEIVIDAMTDEWHFGESRFFTGVGNLTVELWNLARGGQNGNDLLIDDITVKVDEPNTALVASGDNVIIDGSDVTGPCGTSYYLNVDKDEVEKSWGNPYYLWLYKTPSMNDFEPHPTFVSSSVQQPNLDVNTAYKVIVGASEQACLDYYRGSATGGCVTAVETNVIISHCTPVVLEMDGSGACNSVTLKASEDAYLFYSLDGQTWTQVRDQSGLVHGTLFELDITENIYYKVGVRLSYNVWSYSNVIRLEYYQLEQLVQEAGKASSVTNTTLYVEKGSDIELLAAAASYVGGADYTFTDITSPNTPVQVGVLTQAQVEAGESIMVSKIEENRVFSMSAGTLSATSGLALCTANNVTVTVQDTVEIPEPDPDHGVVPIRHTGCNSVVVTSESSTDNVYWFSGVKSAAGSEIEWTMIGSEPIGKVLEVEMTANAPRYYRAGVKKATAQGEDWNYSRTVELEYYQLEQLVQEAGKASSVTNTTLYVEKGSDIELLAAAASYVGGADYTFTDITSPNTPVQVGVLTQAQVEAGESIMVSKIEENRVFSMSAGTLSATSALALCTANNVTVTVQDTVEIPEPDPDHGVVPIRHTGCNNVVVTSESSTDNVYWFSGVKSAAGSEIEWMMIGSEPIGKVFEVEMTANAPRYYRAGVKKATAQGEDWNYSRTVELEYYQLEQLVQEAGKASSVTNTTLYVEKGSDIELLAAAASYVGGASYSFTDVTNPDSPAAVGTLSQAQVEAGESIMVSKIEGNRVFSMSAGTLSATSGLALCTANNVTVTVQDTVEIPEPDPDHGVVPIRHTGCNSVVVTSESSTDNVYWFSGVKSAAGSEIEWTMIGSEPIGKVLEVEMTANAPRYYRAGVKKSTAQGEDWNYSRTVELEYYQLEQLVQEAGKASSVTNTTLYVEKGSDIELLAAAASYVGGASYSFTDVTNPDSPAAVGTLSQAQVEAGESIMVSKIEENRVFSMSAGTLSATSGLALCTANNVTVTVQDTVEIPEPDPDHGVVPIRHTGCNNVVVTSESSTDNVYWFSGVKSAAGSEIEWTMIGSEPIGKVFEVEMTANAPRYYRAGVKKATAQGEDWNYSRTVELEYYSVSAVIYPAGMPEQASDKVTIPYGSDIVVALGDNTYAGADAEYKFYDKDDNLIGTVKAGDTDKGVTLKNLIEDNEYHVSTDLCVSNNVSVTVLGSVTIDIKRNCNQVTADAIMEGSGQITWYYRTTGDWQLIESASQEITLDIKENTQLKAVMGTIESEVVDVEYYDLSLSVINDGTGESSENLNIVIGAKVRLSAQATGMPGEGVYDFYDENNVLVAQMSADMPEYECAPSVDKQYYVTFSGCSSNRVNVKVDWPTVFTPYNADGFNDDFVKDVEPAIAVKVFDRSGNMVADSDNGWDGYVASGNLAMPGVYYYVAVLSDGTVRRGPIEVYKK